MVKFGVYLPIFSGQVSEGSLWGLTFRTALLAEKVGLDSLWVPDHLHGFTTLTKVETGIPMLESMTTLPALASVTKRAKLGPSVACLLFRNPALMAKMVATLDVISGGRVILGVGAGWRREEFDGYGYGWEPIDVRLEKTKEAIEIIKRLWTEPRVTFKGEYYKLVRGEVYPKPIQKPRPPIWFGGVGPKALKLLRFVDGWLAPPLNLEDLRTRLEAAGVKNDFKVAMELYTCIDQNGDGALERSRFSLERQFANPIDKISEYDAGVKLPSGIVVRYGATVGDPDKCINHIERYVEAGVQHFILHFMPLEDSDRQVKLYAEKVVPYFKG